MPWADEILLAEDDTNFALLFETACEYAGLPNPIRLVTDGQEAIDYLQGHAPYQDRQAHPMPSLVVLDQRLPQLNGLEVLRWIRLQPELRDLTVVMLSGTEVPGEAQLAGELGAASYLVKPFQFQDLMALALELRGWLDRHLPPNDGEQAA
jgi:CheY-like chemotaxis protein